MSCQTQDIVIDCMDKRTLATFPGNKHLLDEGKLAEAKDVCMTALKKERSCNRGGRRRRKSRRSRKSKRKSRRKKRKSKKRKTRRRRRRRK